MRYGDCVLGKISFLKPTWNFSPVDIFDALINTNKSKLTYFRSNESQITGDATDLQCMWATWLLSVEVPSE